MQFSSGRNKGATETSQEAQWRQCGRFGYNQDKAERRVGGGGLFVSLRVAAVSAQF